MTAQSTATSEPKDVVLRFMKLMSTSNNDDRDQAMEMFAEDATVWIAGNLPYSGTTQGKAKIIEKIYMPARTRMISGTKSLNIHSVITEGDLVVVEWTSRRTTVAGKDYQNDLCGIFRVQDGKIKMLREYLDTLHAKAMNWPDAEAKAS